MRVIFTMIPDFRLVVLVKLINLVTDALFLCLNAKIIKLEYIIFSLNIISEKLLAIFPMNTGFLDDFSNEVIGYYIGLIGVYFAVLIVVIQMYKGRRYLGEEISRSILFGSKNANFSIIALTWILNIVFILFTFVFQAINLIPLVFLAFIAYFVYMAYWVLKYINTMISDDYKKTIENKLLNRIAEENPYELSKDIKFNNNEELEEILDFFIDNVTSDEFVKQNKNFIELFRYISKNIYFEKSYIVILFKKINKFDDSYIYRTNYISLKLNHSKLAAFIKNNLDEKNFDFYHEGILKILGNQVHLTEIYSEYYSTMFYEYLSAIFKNQNLSDDNKNLISRELHFLLKEIQKSSNNDLLKIKYYIDYMRAIILLDIVENINAMAVVFCESENSIMLYVIIITCIILYFEDKKNYASKYKYFLLYCVDAIDNEKFLFYLKELEHYIIHWNENINVFTLSADMKIENKIEVMTQYIFIKKYLTSRRLSISDINLFKKLNNDNLKNELNKVADFFEIDEITDEKLTEYERVIEKFEKNINKLVK